MPPSCIWQSWSQAPAIPGWLAWLRGNLVASNIPDAGKASQAASSVHGAASSPVCRGASLRHEMVRDPGPGRGRCSLRNVCIGQFTSKQAWLQPARPALFSPSLIQICPVNKAIHAASPAWPGPRQITPTNGQTVNKPQYRLRHISGNQTKTWIGSWQRLGVFLRSDHWENWEIFCLFVLLRTWAASRWRLCRLSPTKTISWYV